MIQKSILFTKRELDVIDKRLKNKTLTQQDSNYLSRYVRPKLREMSTIDSKLLLKKLQYNQKQASIEKKLKRLITSTLENAISITLYGSVIYNNYQEYNDIDVLVVVKDKVWNNLGEKYKLIAMIRQKAKKLGLNIDLELYDQKTIHNSYQVSPDLVYQLSDSRTIYGILKLQEKIAIPKLALRMKLDYSILEKGSTDAEIYKAIRNLHLVTLIMDKTLSNHLLLQSMEDELGKNTVKRLKEDTATKTDRKIALIYLENKLKITINNLDNSKWEKIAL